MVQGINGYVEGLKTAQPRTVANVTAKDTGITGSMENAALVIWITTATPTIGLHVLLDILKSTMYLKTGKTVCLVVCMLLQLYIRNRTFNKYIHLNTHIKNSR